jgi:hypothetical protein
MALTRRTRAAVVIGLLLLAWTILVPASSAVAAGGMSGSCVAAGSSPVSFVGGGFFTPDAATYTYTTHDSLCTMPDPSVHSGVEHGSATGTLNCASLGGSFTGQFTVTWNNHRTSTVDYTENIVYGVNQSHGTFVAGEFQGMTFTHAGVDVALNPTACFKTRGTLHISYTGVYSYRS